MTLSRKFLGRIAIQDNANKVIGVDLSALLMRLILFETTIIHSVWLEDMELLVDAFGAEGLTHLLKEGALKVYCESYTIGETGRVRAALNFTDNNKPLPLCSYNYSVLRVKDQDDRVRKQLEKLATLPRVAAAERLYLADELEKNLILMPDSFSRTVFDGFYSDLRSRPEVIKIALETELKRLGIKPKNLRLRIEETALEDFRLDTNMAMNYGLTETTAHRIGDTALMACVNLNVWLASMMTYSALCGTSDADLRLLQGKLALVGSLVDRGRNEGQFDRVLQLVGLPIAHLGRNKLDAAKILRLRESDNCRAFRDWLGETERLSDREIEARLAGVRSTVKAALNSSYGRKMRFLISNGLQAVTGATMGVAAGVAVAVGISALDSFLIERLAPRDGIVSFLGEEYPSVFETR